MVRKVMKEDCESVYSVREEWNEGGGVKRACCDEKKRALWTLSSLIRKQKMHSFSPPPSRHIHTDREKRRSNAGQ